jgi:hypothetical protein
MNIQLRNNSNFNPVYAFITGQALDHNNQVCLIQSDGKTPYYPVSPPNIQSPLQANCAIPIAPHATVTVTIPQLAGGRIWFSVGSPLVFLLNPGPALVEPSVSNPTDPSINILWSFCEFTFANGSIYANISYVDFVSLPISLSLTPTTGAVQEVLGLKSTGLADIVNGLNAIGGDWAKLPFNGPNGQPLRILSPNNALVMNGGNLFKGYFEPYVNQVFSQYANTPLPVDTQAQWGQLSGKVVNGLLTFPGIGTFSPPSTADIFSCSTGPFASNVNALGPLTARISAGFNRSTLHQEVIHPQEVAVPSFYQQPITNHYSALVHAANIDGRGYAFPYDDVPGDGVDQSGFVNGAPKTFVVTLGGETF